MKVLDAGDRVYKLEPDLNEYGWFVVTIPKFPNSGTLEPAGYVVLKSNVAIWL